MKFNTLCSLILSTILLSSSLSYNADLCEAERYISFDKNGKYSGLTEYSKNLIKSTHDLLQRRKELFARNFQQFDSIFHAAHTNRLAKGNMFIYGPPGGAKSKFIKWLFSQEPEPAFELQMHQMMTEQAFVGGQNFDAARAGRFEINTSGSLADFRVALIDEIDKGNPAALAALLSLLNERQVLAGNKVYQSRLETIFSTSNANMYEMQQQFAENGLRSTASALLNRFTSIAFIPNWLPKSDQALIDKQYITLLDSLFMPCPQEYEEVSSQPLSLDWEGLRKLAQYILRPTAEYYSVSRELFETLREQTSAAVESFKNGETNLYSSEEALPYYPTAEYTERLRQRINDLIIMSLFLDILMSPIAENVQKLEKTLKALPFHRLPIGPLSLWRSYVSVTTITFGMPKLLFPTAANQLESIDMDFGNFFASKDGLKLNYKAKDKREEQNILHITQEQQRFRTALLKTIKNHKQITKEAADFNGLFSCIAGRAAAEDIQDLERLLFVLR